jgi:hypothetical protein
MYNLILIIISSFAVSLKNPREGTATNEKMAMPINMTEK